MLKPVFVAATLAGLLCSGTAMAGGFGIGTQASTLGFGLLGGIGINDNFGVRANLNAFGYDYNDTREGIDYKTTTTLRTVGLLGDWFPFAGGFRVTAGLYNNANKFELDGEPSGGSYTFTNGTTYTSAEIGSLTGSIDYNKKAAPYLGLGWGHVGGKAGLSFMVDAGILFTGKPQVDLQGECGTALADPTACAQMRADIEAEEVELQKEADKISFYPVISLGVAYTF